MTSGLAERYDFFLSRRGSVAAIAREVTDVLLEKGYKVRVEDYDFRLGTSFIEEMHEAITRSRGLIILFTEDYLRLPYTRKEFTSFEAQRLRSPEERHVAILRCEDAPLEGLLADVAYQNLVGVVDPDERRRRIIAAAERQSQSAPPPPRPRPFMGVPPRIASFTGRAHDLTRLDAILMQERSAAVTQAVGRAAIQGMGGVGKTSLVVEYAHRYRKLYAGVCWCPAETRTGLLSALASLAVALGAARPEEADVDSAAKAALRRLAEQHATWLLIYDNVTAPDHVADLLPSAGARVLITSRFSDWGEVADEVALDVLPLEEAVALLQRRTARSDAAGARMLAEALGCLPLALDHAAAYCRRSQMRFADYAKKASSIISTVPRGAGYPRSVAATFDLAIAEAVAQCQAAEALMAYLAQCAPERIPMTLIEGAIEDEAERMKALTALSEVSLAKHDPFEDGTPAVTVHRLVQAVAIARSEAKGSAQDAKGRLIARLGAIYPEDEPSKDPNLWPLCSQLTPHLLALREARSDAASDITDWANLLDRAGHLLGRAAQLTPKRRPLFVMSLQYVRRCSAPSIPLRQRASTTSPSCASLRATMQRRGHSTSAHWPYAKRCSAPSIPIRQPASTPSPSCSRLRATMQRRGHSSSAHWPYAKRCSAPSIPVRQPASTTSAACSRLRATMQRRGHSSSAHWPYAKRCSAPSIPVRQPASPTSPACSTLGATMQRRGRYTSAHWPYAKRCSAPSIPVRQPASTTSPTCSKLRATIAAARPLLRARTGHTRKGARPRASPYGREPQQPRHPAPVSGRLCSGAATLRARTGHTRKGARPRASRTADSLDNLGILLQTLGDPAGARPLHERALAIREKALGPEHPGTATSLNNLAKSLLLKGDLTGARPLYERALAIGGKTLAPEHPNTNRARSNLSRLLLMSGQPTEAFAASETALIAHDKVLGRDHRWTKDSARVTADALDALGRTEEAKALRERYGLTPPEKPQSS